jgi:hypothetical protein
MADYDFVFKLFSSYSAPGMSNEDHKNTSVKIANLWAEFLNLRPHDYETEVLITQSPSLMKNKSEAVQ